jgi:hypothetical protein
LLSRGSSKTEEATPRGRLDKLIYFNNILYMDTTVTALEPLAKPAGVFRPERVSVSSWKLLRLQGYRDIDKVRPAVREAAEEMTARANLLMAPEVHYCSAAVVAVEDEALVLKDGTVFRSRAFRHFVSDACEVVAIVATLGRALDQEVIGMIDRFEVLEALLLESAGWLGIEAASKAFADLLRNQCAGRGLQVSVRMAPGYTYRIDGAEVTWPLEQQQELFGLFASAGHELTVRLMPSCAMLPKMSRSGIYGIVPAGRPTRTRTAPHSPQGRLGQDRSATDVTSVRPASALLH